MYNKHNTICNKSGIKIHESKDLNSSVLLQSKLTKPISFQNTSLKSLDLNLENYSLEDLYNLFNMNGRQLDEETLKYAKQIVLKMHPDKSGLDSKYFLFFSNAYKRIYGIYEFQNKSTKKQFKDEDYFDESNKRILDNMFEKNKDFKDSNNFNSWFNKTFEKHRLEDPNEQGYGNWLKSNEGFISINETVSKGNMNDIFEQKKKQIQSVIVYTGVNDTFASTLGGSLLTDSDNFSTETYTDLRQAYTETLIPVTMEDYNKVQKFNNVSDYKRHRENVDVTPISQQESERKLMQQQHENDKYSSALAFKYAQESEKNKQKQKSFWSDLKQITGW